MPVTRRTALAAALGLRAAAAQPAWIPLFDGRSLDGWKEAPFTGRGKVTVRDGIIELGAGRMTGITWTRPFPKINYEIAFDAVRLSGRDFFAGLTFPIHDSFCSWINGGWDGTTVGLSNVDGYDASENETSTNRDFDTGRWYAFHLSLSSARLRASIDGKAVIDLPLEGRDFSLYFGEMDFSTPLGFASYATVAGLRNLKYRLL